MTPEKLKELMKTHKLNTKRTASIVKVSDSCIYMWLRGKRNIPELKWDCLQAYVAGDGSGKVLRFDATWSIK